MMERALDLIEVEKVRPSAMALMRAFSRDRAGNASGVGWRTDTVLQDTLPHLDGGESRLEQTLTVVSHAPARCTFHGFLVLQMSSGPSSSPALGYCDGVSRAL